MDLSHSRPLTLTRWLLVLTVSALVSACGGGGGGESALPPENVTLSGKVTFDLVPATPGGLDYANTRVTPVVGIQVYAIDPTSGSILGSSDNTDSGGNYRMTVPSSTNMYVRGKAQMVTPDWSVRVVDNDGLRESWPEIQAKPVWAVISPEFSSGTSNRTMNVHAASGWTGSAYTEPRAAAPFSILYAVKQAMDLVLQVDPNASFPPLDLNWSPNNDPAGEVYTSFYDGTEIFLLGKADIDTEEYDHGVIVHEWGHYFEDVFSRSDSIGGSHGRGDVLDARVAFGEGWGNAFQGMARGTSMYIDTNSARQDLAFSFDVEGNCESGWGPRGWFNECSVQSSLYDMFDTVNDGSDTISLGFGPIYDVLVADQRDTQSLTTIHAFAKFLRDQNGASQAGIDGLLDYHDIVSGAALDIWASNEANAASSRTDGLDTEVRNSILPFYKNDFGLGSPVNLCVDVDPTEGDYNMLGNRQFIRFTVPSTGLYQITSTTTFIEPGLTVTPDPDMILYNRGPTHFAFDAPNPVETFCGSGQTFDFGPCVGGMLSLDANVDYVLEVQDDNDLSYDLDPAHIGKYCMTIELSQ